MCADLQVEALHSSVSISWGHVRESLVRGWRVGVQDDPSSARTLNPCEPVSVVQFGRQSDSCLDA